MENYKVHSTRPNPMPKALPEKVAQKMIEQDRVLSLLDIEIEQVDIGFARASMKITKEMLNGFNIAHGGMTFSLADTAFAYACNSRNQLTVAASAKVKFLKMVRLGDKLTATAKERAISGKKGIYDVRVENQNGELVALFEGKSHALDEKVDCGL